MKTTHLIAAAMAGSLGAGIATTQAAVLQSGDLLTIGAGSWFALDMDLNGQIAPEERTPVYPGSSGGVVIGGDGIVTPQVIGQIDTWTLFGLPGNHYTTVMPTGSTETGLDFGGWSIYHNGATVDASTGSGAWTPSNCGILGCAGVSFVADVAAISWSGVYGDSYSLWYSWEFQDASPGAMIPTRYVLHLEGAVIASVPVPAALWLLGSGILALGISARRGRATGRSHPSLP